MLLGVFLYAYATGVRSSRQIERRCTEDIAFRVLSGNSAPDHVTIARFRARHEQALAGFLVASLRLCQAAGLVRLGLVCLDGTKLAADASAAANHTHATLEDQVAELLREAAEADRADHAQHGGARGDELPQQLAGRRDRLARLRQAKPSSNTTPPSANAATSSVSPRWLRVREPVGSSPAPTSARAPATRPPGPTPPPTPQTPTAGCAQPRRHHPGLQRPSRDHHRADHHRRRTHPAGRRPPAAGPMLAATRRTLAAAGITQRPARLAADCGYWSIANLTSIPDAPELLIPPARHARHGKPRKDGRPSESKSDALRDTMTAKLATDEGKALYALRSRTIEPVFGQIKTVQGARRFSRRGLAACQAEWQLLCATHNLLKLWRHTTSPR